MVIGPDGPAIDRGREQADPAAQTAQAVRGVGLAATGHGDHHLGIATTDAVDHLPAIVVIGPAGLRRVTATTVHVGHRGETATIDHEDLRRVTETTDHRDRLPETVRNGQRVHGVLVPGGR